MTTSSTVAPRDHRPGVSPAQEAFLAASGDLTTPFLVLDLDIVAERFAASARRAARRRHLLRDEGQPGAAGAVPPRRAGLLLRRRQPRRDRPVPRRGHRPGVPVLRQHDQEGARRRRAARDGVRTFAVDCEAELEKVARHAPTPPCTSAWPPTAPAPTGRCRASSGAARRGRQAGAPGVLPRAGGGRIVPRRVAAAGPDGLGRAARRRRPSSSTASSPPAGGPPASTSAEDCRAPTHR